MRAWGACGRSSILRSPTRNLVMNKSIHFLNGKFVKDKDLVVSARDLGYTRGYAVFDFLRTYQNRPFKLSEHLDRLFNSARLINLEIPWTKKQIAKWVYYTLEKNDKNTEKTIKIIISGGISNTMLAGDNPTIMIVIDPRSPYPPINYTKGVSAISVKFTRYIPEAKTNNYIEGVKQTKIAKTKGAIEPIYFDDKQVLEGSNSNIFCVIDNKLVTPKTNILKGITRGILLEILDLDIPIKVKDFTLKELLNAKEAFFTGSNREITPIVKIDNHIIGDGKVGKITKEVMRQFKEYTSKLPKEPRLPR